MSFRTERILCCVAINFTHYKVDRTAAYSRHVVVAGVAPPRAPSAATDDPSNCDHEMKINDRGDWPVQLRSTHFDFELHS